MLSSLPKLRAAVVAAALVVLALPASASAHDDAGTFCRESEVVPGTCVGAEKLAERGAAECRRTGAASDEQCPPPIGRKVIRKHVDAHEGSWLDRTLAFQYALANDVPFRDAPWIGTHNSYNSTSEFPTLSHTDSNQQLSLTDQLRIGVRSLELDVHWIPSPHAGGQPAPVVCHGRGRGEMHAGCTTERLLGPTLDEIAAWLRDHSDQVLLLYVEDHIDTPEGYTPTAEVLDSRLRAKDGRSLIYRPPAGGACADLPLTATRDDVLARRAQVVIVSDCGSGAAWRGVVFNWKNGEVESRNQGYRDFPVCDQDPDGDGTPEFGRDVYASKVVRYFEDSTWVAPTASNVGLASTDDGLTPETVRRMSRCGVDLLGLDQLLPRDGRLDALAWSWAAGQPADPDECTVQRADGRWTSRRCRDRRRPACVRPDGTWIVPKRRVRERDAAAECRKNGATYSAPRTGHQNVLLRQAATGKRGDEVWLPA